MQLQIDDELVAAMAEFQNVPVGRLSTIHFARIFQLAVDGRLGMDGVAVSHNEFKSFACDRWAVVLRLFREDGALRRALKTSDQSG